MHLVKSCVCHTSIPSNYIVQSRLFALYTRICYYSRLAFKCHIKCVGGPVTKDYNFDTLYFSFAQFRKPILVIYWDMYILSTKY